MRVNWIEQKGLLLMFLVVVLIIATPLLCLTLLAPAGANDVGMKEVKVELQTSDSDTAVYCNFMTPVGIRNPETAKAAGIRGYVDLEWKGNIDDKLYMKRGEQWAGVLLATFVSYSPELKEVTVNFNPKDDRGGSASREYLLEDGSHVWVDYSDLISYQPKGSITIAAGETKQIKVTYSIPQDLPQLVFTKDFPKELRDKVENTLFLTVVGVYTDAPDVPLLGDKLTQEFVIP